MVRITLNDNIIFDYSVGFANREKQVRFDENSVFTLYSLTKPFTAIGIMKLVDKGLVDLEAHPQKYVPEMAGFGCAVSDFGGKMRIQHSGGFTGFRTFHVQIFDDDFDIIILANSGFGMFRLDITDKIFELYYETNGERINLASMDVGYAT